jgi:hypothetical protein
MTRHAISAPAPQQPRPVTPLTRPALPLDDNRAPYQVCRPGLPRKLREPEAAGPRPRRPSAGAAIRLVLGGLGECVRPWRKSAGLGMDQGKERRFPGRRARHLLGTARTLPLMHVQRLRTGEGQASLRNFGDVSIGQRCRARLRCAHRGPRLRTVLGRARSPRALLPRIVPQPAHSLHRPGRRARAEAGGSDLIAATGPVVTTPRGRPASPRAPRDRGAPLGRRVQGPAAGPSAQAMADDSDGAAQAATTEEISTQKAREQPRKAPKQPPISPNEAPAPPDAWAGLRLVGRCGRTATSQPAHSSSSPAGRRCPCHRCPR